MDGLLDKYAFGWIEKPWAYTTSEFEIFPNSDNERNVADMAAAGIASQDWIYPPIVQRADRHIAGPEIMFLLPSTHYIKIDPKIDRPQMADFLILVLGFLLGLKLNPAGIGHLHRTPRNIGYLVNFTPIGRDIERAMRHVIAFFTSNEHNPEALSLAGAAFHWYLTSQSYHHAFEMFTFQYSVLDNVHKLTRLLNPAYRAAQSKGHAQRPVELSKLYSIPLPSSFQDINSSSPNAKRLADVRNELIHEARWLGEPLGYAADADSWNMLQNLKHFNSQILLGVMGVECRFRSLLYNRTLQGLDVTT